MKYYSIGYAVNDGLPEVTREDVQKLTHMNLAFGLISENGLLDLHQMTHLDLIPQFRDWNRTTQSSCKLCATPLA